MYTCIIHKGLHCITSFKMC